MTDHKSAVSQKPLRKMIQGREYVQLCQMLLRRWDDGWGNGSVEDLVTHAIVIPKDKLGHNADERGPDVIEGE